MTVEWTKKMMNEILDKLMADVGKEEPKPSALNAMLGRLNPRNIFGKGSNGTGTS